MESWASLFIMQYIKAPKMTGSKRSGEYETAQEREEKSTTQDCALWCIPSFVSSRLWRFYIFENRCERLNFHHPGKLRPRSKKGDNGYNRTQTELCAWITYIYFSRPRISKMMSVMLLQLLFNFIYGTSSFWSHKSVLFCGCPGRGKYLKNGYIGSCTMMFLLFG